MGNSQRPMDGKICMVTGATAGIGLVTAREMAQLGATVVLVGRNPQKTEQVVQQLRSQTGSSKLEHLLADLSSQKQVRGLAEAFRSRHDRLDVLVNNAGALFMAREQTEDGIEQTFALNHLSYFLLTHLLLEPLKAAAPSRIANVSSHAHKGMKLDFQDLEGRTKYSGWMAYGRSKLANILFTYELARRLEGTGITANALHPGFVASSFGHNNGKVARVLLKIGQLFAISEDKGAETSIYLASSPEAEGVTGKYFFKKRAVHSSRASQDPESARELWRISERMTGVQAS